MRFLRDRFSKWLSKWIRKIPKNDWDFELVELTDSQGDPILGVKIIRGLYTGLVYYYSSVKVMESPEQETATIRFGFNIVEPCPGLVDEPLTQMMGEILSELIMAGEVVTQTRFDKESNAQIRNDHPEESDSQ